MAITDSKTIQSYSNTYECIEISMIFKKKSKVRKLDLLSMNSKKILEMHTVKVQMVYSSHIKLCIECMIFRHIKPYETREWKQNSTLALTNLSLKTWDFIRPTNGFIQLSVGDSCGLINAFDLNQAYSHGPNLLCDIIHTQMNPKLKKKKKSPHSDSFICAFETCEINSKSFLARNSVV